MKHHESSNFLPSVRRTNKQQKSTALEKNMAPKYFWFHMSKSVLISHRKYASSLCDILVQHFTVTTQLSQFIAECGMIILPVQGPRWHSPHCGPDPWREEGSATTAQFHRWRRSPGGLCLGRWSCSSHRTDPEWRQLFSIQTHTHPNNCTTTTCGFL